jgi:hypothetical protein
VRSSAAGAVLGADAGGALGYLWGGVGGGYVCIMTGGQHMDDPNNPTVPKNDPILGLWYQTKTIVGRAWKNHIARRGGCYWAPRCADLVGRKAFWDLTSLRQANPATDVRWGTESQARPSANVDWVEVARELRKKYEWLADTAQRLEKAQRNAK